MHHLGQAGCHAAPRGGARDSAPHVGLDNVGLGVHRTTTVMRSAFVSSSAESSLRGDVFPNHLHPTPISLPIPVAHQPLLKRTGLQRLAPPDQVRGGAYVEPHGGSCSTGTRAVQALAPVLHLSRRLRWLATNFSHLYPN